jgi:hypothetical protein
MTDFAKFIAQKELVYLLKLTIHTSSYYSAEDVCNSTLVEFELLLELKFEQKNSTSLDTPCYKAASSLKQSVRGQYVCPFQLCILDIVRSFTRTLPEGDENIDDKSVFFLGPSLISFVLGSYDESSQLRAISLRNS